MKKKKDRIGRRRIRLDGEWIGWKTKDTVGRRIIRFEEEEG